MRVEPHERDQCPEKSHPRGTPHPSASRGHSEQVPSTAQEVGSDQTLKLAAPCTPSLQAVGLNLCGL